MIFGQRTAFHLGSVWHAEVVWSNLFSLKRYQEPEGFTLYLTDASMCQLLQDPSALTDLQANRRHARAAPYRRSAVRFPALGDEVNAPQLHTVKKTERIHKQTSPSCPDQWPSVPQWCWLSAQAGQKVPAFICSFGRRWNSEACSRVCMRPWMQTAQYLEKQHFFPVCVWKIRNVKSWTSELKAGSCRLCGFKAFCNQISQHHYCLWAADASTPPHPDLIHQHRLQVDFVFFNTIIYTVKGWTDHQWRPQLEEEEEITTRSRSRRNRWRIRRQN